MNKYDEIKSLVEASRRALNKGMLNEMVEIRKTYGFLNEQTIDIDKESDLTNDDEFETAPKDSDDIGKKSDKQRTYKVMGDIIVLHGKDKPSLQLTTDEKNAFTESMDEFREEVAEIVDFGKLSVFDDNVEWTGKIKELDLEFFFSINESDGLYINGQMIHIDQDYMNMVMKLQSYYQKFKTKWSKVIASRQTTDTE
tara:strand:+ start:1061 stop:1651 length:591 start_codon:yes stop_codon:yes gene_type:complete